ncbi:MAG: hypothetical protein AVDCRST_MAG66-865, partial [uncultured Pseudonocardia sp.]
AVPVPPRRDRGRPRPGRRSAEHADRRTAQPALLGVARTPGGRAAGLPRRRPV